MTATAADAARIKVEVHEMGRRYLDLPLSTGETLDGLAALIISSEAGSTRVRAMATGIGKNSIREHYLWCLTDEYLYEIRGELHLTSLRKTTRRFPVDDFASINSTRASGGIAVRGIDVFLLGTRLQYLPQCKRPESIRRMISAFRDLHEERVAGGELRPLAAILIDQVEAVFGLDGVRGGMTGILAFFRDRIEFRDIRSADLPPIASKPLRSIHTLGVGGPGEFSTGGGFIGGGFGIEGAAIGMVAASIMNSLTTKSSTLTIIEMTGAGYQLGAISRRFNPETLNNALFPVYAEIRNQQAEWALPTHAQESTTSDVSESLARLVSFLNAGVLSRDEFEAAKNRLLFPS